MLVSLFEILYGVRMKKYSPKGKGYDALFMFLTSPQQRLVVDTAAAKSHSHAGYTKFIMATRRS